MTLKELPMTRDGTWRPGAQRIADALHMLPEDLWPDAVQITLEKSTGIGYFEADQIERLVDMSRDRFESQQLAGHLLECLTNREKDVIRRRFEDDQLLNDIAKDLDVSRTRVQQIEAKAMRKLRAQAVKENIINPFVE
jgi:RNA polymerase sigma factor (sigma-70 family)